MIWREDNLQVLFEYLAFKLGKYISQFKLDLKSSFSVKGHVVKTLTCLSPEIKFTV